MKYIILILALAISACSTQEKQPVDLSILEETEPVMAAVVSAPFSRGVNFSGWFEVTNAQRIPFQHYNEQDFIDVKNLGADVIRLPVRLNDMTQGEPDYELDPLFYGSLILR